MFDVHVTLDGKERTDLKPSFLAVDELDSMASLS